MSLDLGQAMRDTMREVVREEIRAAMKELGGNVGGADSPVSYAEAAKLVGYHVSTITKWVHSGLLPAHGRGKGKRVYRADVLRALELVSTPKVELTAKDIADDILAGNKVRRIR